MPSLPDRIETERLTLRFWTVEDIPALSNAIEASVDHLRPWMAWVADEPISDADRAEKMDEWSEETRRAGGAPYGIWHEDVLVGTVGLHPRESPEVLEIGYWIHVDHIGKGYALEAARALTEVAFEIDGIDSVEIHHDWANLPSRRIPEKLGFTVRAEEPKEIAAPAETGVEVQWSVTREQWNSH